MNPFEHRRELTTERVVAFHQSLAVRDYSTREVRLAAVTAFVAGTLSGSVDEDDAPLAAVARGVADALVVVFAEEDRRSGL